MDIFVLSFYLTFLPTTPSLRFFRLSKMNLTLPFKALSLFISSKDCKISFSVHSAWIIPFMTLMWFISVSCLFTFILVSATIWSRLSAGRDHPGQWLHTYSCPGGSCSSWGIFLKIYLKLKCLSAIEKHNLFV